MPYCKHDRHIKGGQKKVAFLCRFFRPTSDVNILKSVYPIYLKIKVQRVPTSHSWHINFWVNRITRFRDIDVGSWPKKTTKKTKFFWPPFIYRVNILDFGTVLTITLDDNSTTIFAYKQLGLSMDIEIFFSACPESQGIKLDNLTTRQLDTFEHWHENKSCSAW